MFFPLSLPKITTPHFLNVLLGFVCSGVILAGHASPAMAQAFSVGVKVDFATGAGPTCVAVGDVNGDGRLDMAATNSGSNTVSVYLGNGLGGFAPKTDFPTGAAPTYVAIGDVNDDGRADLVVTSSGANTVSVYLGNGAGGFGARTDFATGTSPSCVVLGDLNGDGRPDLMIGYSYFYATAVSVLLGAGDGTFAAKTDFPVGAIPSTLTLGDVNGDGRPDCVVANYNSNSVSVLLGNGAGGFGPKTDYATGPTPRAVVATDVNGDGKLDLLAVNGTQYVTGNTVSVLLGAGDGTFGAKTDFPTGSNPNTLAVADLNGDGRPDVVAANTNTNTVSVLLGDGTGALGAKTDIVTGANPFGVVICDLNADGRTDIVVANSGANTASVLLGLTPTRASISATPDPVVLGSPVTLTATVTVPSPGFGAPTDSVRFFDGTTLLGTSPVNGDVAGLALFAPRLGTRSLTAVYKGDGRLFGSISGVKTHHVVATAKPGVASIVDVKGDQGRQVRLRFRASPYDFPGSATPITQYDVFRRANPALSALASGRPVRPAIAVAPAGVLMDSWDYVGTLRAYADSAYMLVVPTLADSNTSGIHRVVLFVRAATATPGKFYDSPADSGYSVDNLPPAPPAPLMAGYANGATHLHWGANSEPDLWYYRVYRGSSAGFSPGANNLIATAADTGYADVGPSGGYYKLSAVDVNGNESGFALLTPANTLDVAGGVSLAFALDGVRPNPSRGRQLSVAFSLAPSGGARLQLLDVSGRQLVMRDVSSLGAGRHTVDLSTDRRLAPGLYLVRLTQGSNTRLTRVVVID